jgi:hypothetical protein
MPTLCFQSADISDFDPETIGEISGVISASQVLEEAGQEKIDPVTFESLAIPMTQLAVQIASMGAVTACINGIFKLLLKKQEGKNQVLKVQAGKLKLEIPGHVTEEDLRRIISPLSELLLISESKPPVVTIDVHKKRLPREVS